MKLHSPVAALLFAAMVAGLYVLTNSVVDRIPVAARDTGYIYRMTHPAPVHAANNIPAYPGCEGYGCIAWQTTRDSIINHGMALNFYPVTNDDSVGSGSLVSALDSAQASCQRGDASIVYVKTGGLTNWNGLTTNQTTWELCNTQVLGTTSQGEGLTIHHEGTGASTGRISGDSDNLIWRGFRQKWMSTGGLTIYNGDKIVRTNWSNQYTAKTSGNGYWFGGLGSPWSVVPNAGWSYYTTDAFILSGHVANHPTVMRGGGRYVSLDRSLIEGPGYRMPMVGGGWPDSIPGVDFTNSVVFNWGTTRLSATDGNAAIAAQFRNIWYKPGAKSDTSQFVSSSPVHMDDACTAYDDSGNIECPRSLFVDNLLFHRNGWDSTSFSYDSIWNGSNPRRGVICRVVDDTPSASDSANVYFQLEQPIVCTGDGNKVVTPINPGFTSPRRDTAWTETAAFPVTILQADTTSIWNAIEDSVGFSWAINCSGVRTSVRDSLDASIIDSVVAGTGRTVTIDLDTITAAHIEVPATGSACTDADGDHLYDSWENTYAGSLTTLDAESVDATGYFAFELMANGSPWTADSVPTWAGLTGSGAFAMNECYDLPVKIHDVSTVANGGGVGTFDSVMHQLTDANFDIVTFSTGGVHSHNVNHRYDPQAECVWIAGETAPGDGFILESTIGNENFFTHRESNNLVVRGMTSRNNGIITGGRAVAGIFNYHHYIWAYNSFYWTNDQLLNYTNNPDSTDTDRIKYGQWSYNLIGPSTNTGMTVQAEGDSKLGACSVTIAWNVWAHVNYRMPLLNNLGPQGCGAEAIENLVYNWQAGESCMIAQNGALLEDTGPQIDGDTELRFVGNWCKPGPRSGSAAGGGGNPVFEQRMVNSGPSPNPNFWVADIFSDRNYTDSAHSSAADTISSGNTQEDDIWHEIDQDGPVGKPNDSTYIADFALDQAFPLERQWSALALMDQLMPVSGNYRGWNCNADEVLRADAVRDSIRHHIESGTGFDREYLEVDSMIVGGYPSTATGSSCAVGSNLVPDSMEVRYFGVADTITLMADHDNDGWPTIVELWLINQDPTVPEGQTGGDNPTYSTSRNVYLIPWVTIARPQPGGGGTDSLRIPDPDSINYLTTLARWWEDPAGTHDSAFVISCESPVAAAQVTETVADSVHADWNLPADPETVTVPGC